MRHDKYITIALSRILLAISVAIATSAAPAAQPSGEYVLGAAKGTALLTFDGAGNFSGTIALPVYGIATISGTETVGAKNAISGTFTLTNQQTGAGLFTGPLSGSISPTTNALVLRLATIPAQTFKGGLRTGVEPVPGGQYFKTQVPNALIFQCDRSGDRQTVTIQGDQDFDLDLTQAVGGQLLFNQKGKAFGVVYENGDPTNPPRFAAAQYDPLKDQLALTLSTSLLNGKRKEQVFLGVGSTGKYDGIYLLNITAGDCGVVQVKITIKDGVITGTDTNTGAISGTIDDSGNLALTTQRLVEPATCSQGGTHTGTISFTGTPSISAVFPIVLNGTFNGAGASGTFTVVQPTGVTGATTPGNLSRSETWAGTFKGSHNSMLCQGGVFGESFTVSLSFPSSLIAALRGKTQILSGSGSVSGAETIQTQGPLSAATCAIVATASEGGSVNVTFAGVFNGTDPAIEFSSSSILIANLVQFNTGPKTGQTLGENRRIIKFRVSFMNATRIEGGWNDGIFVLRKQ